MSDTLLVTGATGLTGANACRMGIERGRRVRALVRNPDDAAPLAELGAELVAGDINDIDSLQVAMKGVTQVLHTAALLGGTWSSWTPEDITRTNRDGAINVLKAAESTGVQRTAMLSSIAICDWSDPLTETSRILPIGASASPYAHAKVAAFYEGMARAARGQFVTTIIPGGIYGPSPVLDRALVPTSVNHTLMSAVTGDLERYLPMKLPWVYVDDVVEVCLGALERGETGARYLALGRVEDAASFPGICNKFAEMAGSSHRVVEFDPTAPGAADDPEYGNMIRYALQPTPDPLFDSSATVRDLGCEPTSTDEGLARTLAWLRAHHKV